MEEIILKVKDRSKITFLKELLEQFDFVEFKGKTKKKKSKHDVFNSAGIWEGRNIDARHLRNEAWTRK